MRDAPLVSARAAGIPKSTHFSPPVTELIPLSVVLPIMGITLWCIWAAYTTTEDGQRRTGPPTEPGLSQGFFFSILSQREFWFLAAVAYGLLSWGHLISSDYRQLDFTDTI